MTPRWARLSFVFCLVLASFAVGSSPARACSCASFDTRRALAEAPAAFVGTVISSRPAEPAPPDDGSPVPAFADVVYRFRVEKAVKGPLGEEVEVRSSGDGASCGISPGEGQPVALILSGQEGDWRGSLCRQTSPAALERAARPLPAPEGDLPPSMVIGSTYGLARSVAIDNDGKVAGLGTGEGLTRSVALCPEGSHVVELFVNYGPDGTEIPGISPRRVTNMTAEGEWSLPEWRRSPSEGVDRGVGPIACANPAGTEVILFASDRAPGTEARILRLVSGLTTTIWQGPAPLTAAFSSDGNTAWLGFAAGDEIDVRRIDLRGPVPERSVGRIPTGAGAVVPGPDGRHLAALVPGDPYRLVVVDVDTGTVRETALGTVAGGDVLWASTSRLVFAPSSTPTAAVRVYGTDLAVISSWSGWSAQVSAVSGNRLVGARQGRVLTAPLTTGPATDGTELEDALVVSVTPIPKATPDDGANAAGDDKPTPGRDPVPAPTTTTSTTRPATTPTPAGPPPPGPSPTTSTTAAVIDAPARPSSTSTTTRERPDVRPADETAASRPRGDDREAGGARSALTLVMMGAGLLAGGTMFALRRRRTPQSQGPAAPGSKDGVGA